MSGAEGDWVVRTIPGAGAVKDYRCPGCGQAIVGGTAHLVCWQLTGGSGVKGRRHWHSPCWRREARRLGLG